MSHEHYFRDVSHLTKIDVYRLLELFGVTCPVAQHVAKKAIAAGQRGHKSTRRDWQDIADSACRKLQMIDEDEAAFMAAGGGNGDHGLTSKIDPDVIATFNSMWQEVRDDVHKVAEMESWPDDLATSSAENTQEAAAHKACGPATNWPDESRRQDAEDVTIWPTEERIDSIGQNGGTGEHYTPPCANCLSCERRP